MNPQNLEHKFEDRSVSQATVTRSRLLQYGSKASPPPVFKIPENNKNMTTHNEEPIHNYEQYFVRHREFLKLKEK